MGFGWVASKINAFLTLIDTFVEEQNVHDKVYSFFAQNFYTQRDKTK